MSASDHPDHDGATGPLGGGGLRGAVGAWLVWWLLSAALWMVLVDNTHFAELMTGIVAAAIGATAATLVRVQREALVRPRAVWLARTWRPLARFPGDLWLLTAALFRRVVLRQPVTGRFFALRFDPGRGDPHAAARLVLAETFGSMAPNTYVVGIDEERGELLVHQLVPSDDRARSADPLELR